MSRVATGTDPSSLCPELDKKSSNLQQPGAVCMLPPLEVRAVHQWLASCQELGEGLAVSD